MAADDGSGYDETDVVMCVVIIVGVGTGVQCSVTCVRCTLDRYSCSVKGVMNNNHRVT